MSKGRKIFDIPIKTISLKRWLLKHIGHSIKTNYSGEEWRKKLQANVYINLYCKKCNEWYWVGKLKVEYRKYCDEIREIISKKY